jgi:hypothetical protein
MIEKNAAECPGMLHCPINRKTEEKKARGGFNALPLPFTR